MLGSYGCRKVVLTRAGLGDCRYVPKNVCAAGEQVTDVIDERFEGKPFDSIEWIEETLRLRGITKIPELLYRFLDPRSPYFKDNIESMLLRDQVYLSSRRDFNDPFEGVCRFDFSTDQALWREHLAYSLRKARGIGKLKARSIVQRETKSLREVKATMLATMSQQLDEAGIACFSESIQSATQWAHYAHNHQGLAIEVRYPGFSAEFPLAPVRYVNEMYSMTLPQTHIGYLFFAALSKDADWAYEREWRLFELQRAGNYFQMPCGSVIRVILGANADQALRDQVLLLSEARLRRGLPSFDVTQAKHAPDSYGIVLT